MLLDFRLAPQMNEKTSSWPSVPSAHAGAGATTNLNQGNKSRFFDDFSSSNTASSSFQSSNNASQRAIGREQERPRFNGNDSIPRPLISYDRQQQQRFSNGYPSHQQRSYRNYRSKPMSSQSRHGPGRETFQGDVNDFNDEFDFETSNRSFNKLASEDEYKQQTDALKDLSWQRPSNSQAQSDHAPIYDKTKSFFDNIPASESSDGSRSAQMQHHQYHHQQPRRVMNQETFGYDSYAQRAKNQRSAGNNQYRRANPNQQRQGNQSNGYYYHHQQQQY